MLDKILGKRLKQEKIIEQWSALIAGAEGQGEKVKQTFTEQLTALDVPSIKVKERTIRSGFEGTIKGKRKYFVVEHKELINYDIYLGVRDYGKQLAVSWYAVKQPTSIWMLFKKHPVQAILGLPFLLMQSAVAMFKGDELSQTLNLFDTEELTAYVSTVHNATKDAVESIMNELNLDFSKVDTKTRGFLNIS